MPSEIKWSTPDSAVSLLTTGLNSLANGSRAISAAHDNDTGLDQFADFELVVTYGTNPASGSSVRLYLIPSLDGTNYADGDASTTPQGAMWVGNFELRVTTSGQRLYLREVPLPPFKFKALVSNEAGQAMAASGNTLKMRTYNPEVQ